MNQDCGANRLTWLITGCRRLDREIKNSPMTLVYGPAASGKTTLLLTIISNICRIRPCLYVSTEGSLYHERIASSKSDYGNTWFTEVYSLDELLDTAATTLQALPVEQVFIDTINALYRLVAYEERSLERLGLTLALLRWKTLKGARVYCSAQVRAGYEDSDEEVTASGMNVLDYWFDMVLRLGRDEGGRFIEIVKPGNRGERYYYIITSRGVEWLDGCSI